MTPSQYYLQQIQEAQKRLDPEQLKIMQRFDKLYVALIQKQSLVSRIKYHFKPSAPEGLYLWGPVGRGKTFLLDCFDHCLPESLKLRLHFHAFMRRIHAELKAMQGHTNPLIAIAKKLRAEFQVLCLDEFFVSDITDAMLLGELLKALFEKGITLVTTSNCAPDQLYRNGLQRDRFLPAIQRIKTHTDVIELSTSQDYRLRHLAEAGVYYTPLDSSAQAKLNALFNKITHAEGVSTEPLNILGRSLPIIKRSTHVVWFDFHTLCGTQRSQNDYLVLSQDFNIVFLSDIPVIKAHQQDLVTNFIKLIDVLYDAHTQVVISAATEATALYPEGPQHFEFQRTQSRLIEMQSIAYFNAGSHDSH